MSEPDVEVTPTRPGDGAVSALETLRRQMREAISTAGLSQAEVARRLGISHKHVNQMLTGRAVLALDWAERIAALCEHHVIITVSPAPAPVTKSTDDLVMCCLCFDGFDRAGLSRNADGDLTDVCMKCRALDIRQALHADHMYETEGAS